MSTLLETPASPFNPNVDDAVADVNPLRATLTRAMFALVKRGDANAVMMCLTEGNIPIDVTDANGHTPLVLALVNWKYVVAHDLIKAGANLHSPYDGDSRYIEKAILGARRYVEERCPELVAVYEQALMHEAASSIEPAQRSVPRPR